MKFARKRQLNISGSHLLRRGISVVLALAIAFQCAIFSAPLTAEAAGASSASWSNLGPVIVNSMNLNMTKRLRALGGGKYELTFTANGFTTVAYDNEYNGVAQEGYYVVYTDGMYQLDLYGGDGGSGSANESGNVDACNGGKGGHVHGQIELQEGQVLYYSLGGNGSTTSAAATGGGANGGGNNSGTGNQTGGGGGYSVVYLLSGFTEDELSTLTLADVQAKLAENTDTYIMIAGGGGGGGDVSWLAQNPAHGGDGGTLNSANYGAAGGSVPGTWYGGTSGTASSGADDEGAAGGGNITTSWSTDRAGGDTERRGGAGGGGFAGGAGGTSVVLLGTGVEGGGGGSSFVADSVNTNVSAIGADTSNTGGSLSVSFLEETHLEDLSKATFSATISEHFTIEKAEVESEDSARIQTVAVDNANNKVSGTLDLLKNTATVKVTLSAKYGDTFGGGNNVPVLLDSYVDVGGEIRHFDNTADNMFDTSGDEDDPLDYVTDYANVPLHFTVTTNSLTGDQVTGSETVADLYKDDFAEHRGADNVLSGASPYSNFIAKVSPYTVKNASDVIVNDSDPANGIYTVSFEVTARTDVGEAVVGAPVSTGTFKGIATISTRVITDNDEHDSVRTITVDAWKNLSHDGQKYQFSVSSTSVITTLHNQVSYEPDIEQSGTQEKEYTINSTGWYYIEAWGADGGDSKTVTLNDNQGDADPAVGLGATGGQAGYASGLYYLTAGSVLTIRTGSKQDAVVWNTSEKPTQDAINCTNTHSSPSRIYSYGLGGQGSYILLGGIPILAAGGGGGAGGAAAIGANARSWTNWFANFESGSLNGVSCTAVPENLIEYSNDMALVVFDGSDGSNPDEDPGFPQHSNSTYSFTGPSKAGTPGNNYVPTATNEAINGSAYDKGNNTLPASVSDRIPTGEDELQQDSDGGGTVRITHVGVTNDYYEDKLPTAAVTVPFSRYFDVDPNTVSLKLGTEWKETSRTTTDGKTTVTYTDTAGDTVGFSYTYFTNDDTNETTYQIVDMHFPVEVEHGTQSATSTGEFEVVFDLTPKSGFLGGNDVPVVVEGSVVNVAVGTGEPEKLDLTVDPAADYANVAINYDLNNITLTPENPEQHVVSGQTIKEPLFSVAVPTKSDDPSIWQDDYVEFANASISPAVVTKPTETIQYTITAGIRPIVVTAQKAVVIEPVSAQYKSIVNTVYVDYSVTVNASNCSVSDDFPTQVAEGESISGYITANDGYDLPASILVDGAKDFTYDAATGQIDIPADKITGNVTITATATLKTYDLHFVLITDNGTYTETELTDLCVHGELHIGDTIDMTEADAYAAGLDAAVDGYSFQWVGLPEDGKMTAGLTIYGGYVPDLHNVTIKYVDGAGNEIFEPYVGQAYYGTEYSVASPVKTGYTPYTGTANAETVSGTMGTEDVEIKVTYIPNDYTLTIKYVDAYGNPMKDDEGNPIADYTEVVTYGVTYSVDSPVITGYTPDLAQVEGTMDTEGKTITVSYTPNEYTLTIVYVYEKGGEAATTYTKQFPYGTEYNVKSPDIESYLADLAVVSGTMGAENVEVTVTYKDIPAGLTVRFFYEDGTPVLDDEGNPIVRHKEGAQADEISFSYENGDFPTIEGHTPTPARAMKPANKASEVVNVYYAPNNYTLTINYVTSDGTTASETHASQVTYGTTYSVTSPTITGYTPDQATVSGTMGAGDLEVRVTYTVNQHTVTAYYYKFGETTPFDSDEKTYNFSEKVEFVFQASLDGYEPRKNKNDTEVWVSETIESMPDEDVEIHVTFYPKRYTLPIIGVDPFGKPWKADDGITNLITGTATIEHGVGTRIDLSKVLTVPEGYTAVDSFGNKITSIIGSWTPSAEAIDENGNITQPYYVTYTKDGAVFYVTVTWGDLVFDYSKGENWDGNTHRYHIPAQTTGTNHVKVENNIMTKAPVYASVYFQAETAYPNMVAEFSIDGETDRNSAKEIISGDTIDAGTAEKYWLWLYGSLTTEQAKATDPLNVGTCTVQISATNLNQ